jgi:hypothetical protein
MSENSQEDQLKEFIENEEAKKAAPKVIEAPTIPMPWQKSEDRISMGNQIGWQKLPLGDLPTKGLFYPESAEILIRAATSAEIRHWSTLQENDPSALDDMLNYVLERCCTYKTPTGISSWKDIKEVDRFYILLGIREYTFINGENNLQVSVSESNKINVSKDMIDYINFDEQIMKYYNPDKRCFSVILKNGKTFDVTIPSVGVTNFLKNYINRKQQRQEAIDSDFITFASFVIMDWKGLSDTTYEKIVIESNNWSDYQISAMTHIKDMFASAINPIIKYTDEGGAERSVPLNFLGGIKSIFLISNPFG